MKRHPAHPKGSSAFPSWVGEAPEVAVPGNQPLLLNNAENIWCVVEGTVDIFATMAALGDYREHLSFLWSAGVGEVIPGGLPRKEGYPGLLAVGNADAKLRRLSRSQLISLLQGARAGHEVEAIVRAALQGPERVMNSGGPPASQPEGEAAFFLEMDAEEFRSPKGPWERLDRAMEDFLGWCQSRILGDRESDVRRLDAKALEETRMFEEGLHGLASVLGEEEALPTAALGASPLLAACQAIGRRSGISFNPPAVWELKRQTLDTLGSICRASRVRYRRVVLEKPWWKKDGGPLLAFLKEGRKPVALLPVGNGAYELLNPEEGIRTPVDPGVANSIEPFGYTFYAPAPDGALFGGALLGLTLSPLWKDLGWILFLSLVAALLGLVVPLATREYFSVVIPQALAFDVWVLFGALVAIVVGGALFDLSRAFLLIRVESKWTLSLQSAVIDRLLSLPVPFYRKYSVGDLAQRANSVDVVRDILTGAAAVSILGVVQAAANLAILFYFDAVLALVAMGLMVFSGLFILIFGRRILFHEKERLEVQGRISGLVFQMIGGIAKLKVAAAERRAFSVWTKRFRDQQELNRMIGADQVAIQTLNDSMPVLSVLALFGTVGFLMSRGYAIPAGTFIAFNAAFGTFFAASIQLSHTLLQILNTEPTLERADPILKTLPEVDGSRPDPGELAGKVEGVHLNFRYHPDGPRILRDVSFSVEPGEFAAFVGRSGSGKSTTLRLLLGFERPESGGIYYDQRELEKVDVTSVRSQIGVVLQNSQLMSGDIFTNIVGSAPLTLDHAWAAAELAGFAADIREMPMGMNTVISEGGSTLSGGQRQRLLIARALVKKPRIIFFDEATSALDNRTQEQVSESLASTKATRIVIAHRLSTIRNADRIFVMDGGQIAQSGTFEELMEEGGLWENLVARQLA